MAEFLDFLARLERMEQDQRQQNNNSDTPTKPICKCGTEMKYMEANDAYTNPGKITCNNCKGTCNDKMIYHCPKDLDWTHPYGSDLCVDCANQHMGNQNGARFAGRNDTPKNPPRNRWNSNQFQMSNNDVDYDPDANFDRTPSNNKKKDKKKKKKKKRKGTSKGSDTDDDSKMDELTMKDIMKLKNKLNTLKKDNEYVKSKMKDLRFELNKYKNENISLRSDNTELNSDLKKLKKDNNNINDDLLSEQRKQHKLLQDQKDRNKDLMNQIKSLKNEIKSYTSKGAKHDMINKSIQNELDRIREENIKLNRIKIDYELKLKQGSEMLKKMKSKHDNDVKKLQKKANNCTQPHLSATMMATLSQQFISKSMNIKIQKNITVLHKELQGMTLATKNALVWLNKHTDNTNNCNNKVNLNDYDINALNVLKNCTSTMLSANDQHIKAAKSWLNKLNVTIKHKMDPKNYKEWQSQDILNWILNLENGKYKKKYEKQLRTYLSQTKITGCSIKKKSKLIDMSIFDFEDQPSILQHISHLTRGCPVNSVTSNQMPFDDEGPEGQSSDNKNGTNGKLPQLF